jgi:hypothetical protein
VLARQEYDEDKDCRFPNDSAVEVRYPRTRQHEHGDRCAWPWVPGSTLDDGSLAPTGTADGELFYPCCFRDASEIRRLTDRARR